MNFCQHGGRWSKKSESSARDPNMSSGTSMGANYSVCTKNLSNWVFSFLLTPPERPLSSMGYENGQRIGGDIYICASVYAHAYYIYTHV